MIKIIGWIVLIVVFLWMGHVIDSVDWTQDDWSDFDEWADNLGIREEDLE